MRGVLGLGVGAAFGFGIEAQMAEVINDEASKLTHQTAGNASVSSQSNDVCAGVGDTRVCEREYDLPKNENANTIIAAPIIEELQFRAAPSFLMDTLSGDSTLAGAAKNVAFGTERPRFTRQEFLTGLGTSVLFGLAHNFTNKGYDARNIPASQTITGMVNWYLMRRAGLGSSILSHIGLNYTALKYNK